MPNFGKRAKSEYQQAASAAHSGIIGEANTKSGNQDVILSEDRALEWHLVLLRQELCHFLPDGSCASLKRESEDCIGSPAGILLVEHHVVDCSVDIDRRYTLAQPLALHVCGGEGPDLYKYLHQHTLMRINHSQVIRLYECYSRLRYQA